VAMGDFRASLPAAPRDPLAGAWLLSPGGRDDGKEQGAYLLHDLRIAGNVLGADLLQEGLPRLAGPLSKAEGQGLGVGRKLALLVRERPADGLRERVAVERLPPDDPPNVIIILMSAIQGSELAGRVKLFGDHRLQGIGLDDRARRGPRQKGRYLARLRVRSDD